MLHVYTTDSTSDGTSSAGYYDDGLCYDYRIQTAAGQRLHHCSLDFHLRHFGLGHRTRLFVRRSQDRGLEVQDDGRLPHGHRRQGRRCLRRSRARAVGSRGRRCLAIAVTSPSPDASSDRPISATLERFGRSAEVAASAAAPGRLHAADSRSPTDDNRSATTEDQAEDRREHCIVRLERVFRKTGTGRVPVAVQTLSALHHVRRAAVFVTVAKARPTIGAIERGRRLCQRHYCTSVT